MSKFVMSGVLALIVCSSAALAANSKAAPAPYAPSEATLNEAFKSSNWPAFQKACKAAFVGENCDFLRGVHDYKVQADNAKRGVLAERIMDMYFGAHATEPLNLPAGVGDQTQKAYDVAKKRKAYPNSLFNAPEAEIQKVLIVNMKTQQRAKFEPVVKTFQ